MRRQRSARQTFTPHHDGLPYGTRDINPAVVHRIPRAGPIRCFIRGCGYLLRPPARDQGDGQVCPVHEIYNHRSGTYRYTDPRRNLIVDGDFFATHLIRHPAKFESHRFGLENSEDALTWNVTRSFQRAGLLHKLAELATGERTTDEPDLYLWGISINRDAVAEDTAAMLLAAREKFEAKVPGGRPKTEPDVMLHLPGRYLVLIEAKFTSSHPFCCNGTEKRGRDMTARQLLSTYRDPDLVMLDHEVAARRDRIPHQLWRNTIFAEWMARHEGPATKAYHATLTGACCETDTATAFRTLLKRRFRGRFRQVTWEQVYGVAAKHRPDLDRLCTYLATKTAGLTKAFSVPDPAGAAVNP